MLILTVFIGDSAASSLLSVLRISFESCFGRCEFIDDPRRHMITEPRFELPNSTPMLNMLPDHNTAKALADSFFVNTLGIIHVFDRDRVMDALRQTYDNPLDAEPAWLCQLNLIFAIGLMMATPKAGTQEHELFERLNHDSDRAEKFYQCARSLSDYQSGIGEADFWSVQALLLTTVFMLTKGKRNAAFSTLSMAISSAYALGLHQESTLPHFHPAEQTLRRNIWKSLFVMDRFMALSLGRPPAIFEDEMYIQATPRSSISSTINSDGNPERGFSQQSTEAIDAAVRASSLVGVILKQVYQQRSIGTNKAQEIAQICKDWPSRISPWLKWPNPSSYPRSVNPNINPMAILNVNCIYIHSVILLTRPFFLYILNFNLQKEETPTAAPQPRPGYNKMKGFSGACVSAATHAINLVRGCYDTGVLPQRNPMVIYFVFSAALILLANDCAKIHPHPHAERCIEYSFEIMNHCAPSDAHAARYEHIMKTFREAILGRRGRDGRENGFQLAPMGPPNNLTGELPSPHAFGSQSGSNFPTPGSAYTPFSGPTVPNPFASSPAQGYNSISSPVPPPGFQTSRKSSSSTPTQSGMPMEPPLPPPSMPPNPLSPSPNRTPLPTPNHGNNGYDAQMNFTPILDLIAYPETLSQLVDDSSVPDEQIDFDMFWNWPQQSNMNMQPVPVQPVQHVDTLYRQSYG
jgi:hypothetical protein